MGDIALLDDASKAPSPTAVYATRWWVLTLYSSIAFLQCLTWGLPGPISSAYASFYGMNSSTVQLLLNYGCIIFIPALIPFAVWMDRPGGLRNAVRTGLALVTASAVLRLCARDASVTSQVLVHASFLLNALAGPVAMSGVSKVSEDWFPPHERTMATAIMSEANAMSFALILSPFVVTVPDAAHMNLLSLIVLCVTAPFFIASLVYFPSHPPLPPSISASHQQAHEAAFTLPVIRATLWRLVRDRRFMLLALCYGITVGTYGSWVTVLSIVLGNLNLSPQTMGLIGFTGNLVGNIAGVVVGRIADAKHNHKSLIIVLLAGSSISFFLFTLLCIPGLLPASVSTGLTATTALFGLSAMGGLCVYGTIPLFFELAVEIVYPTPESTIVGMMALMNNAGGVLFLSIPSSSVGNAWMNWFMTAVCVMAFFAVTFGFHGEAVRYKVDTGEIVEREDGTIVESSDGSGDGLMQLPKGDDVLANKQALLMHASYSINT